MTTRQEIAARMDSLKRDNDTLASNLRDAEDALDRERDFAGLLQYHLDRAVEFLTELEWSLYREVSGLAPSTPKLDQHRAVQDLLQRIGQIETDH